MRFVPRTGLTSMDRWIRSAAVVTASGSAAGSFAEPPAGFSSGHDPLGDLAVSHELCLGGEDLGVGRRVPAGRSRRPRTSSPASGSRFRSVVARYIGAESQVMTPAAASAARTQSTISQRRRRSTSSVRRQRRASEARALPRGDRQRAEAATWDRVPYSRNFQSSIALARVPHPRPRRCAPSSFAAIRSCGPGLRIHVC